MKKYMAYAVLALNILCFNVVSAEGIMEMIA